MNECILIAEDDGDIVELLRLYLTNAGYQVVAGMNGREALELMQEHPVSLALVDLMMPEMDGYELIRRIRESSNIPVIILSAKSLEQEKIEGLEIGADYYITKPFRPSEVVAYVKALLRRYYKLGAETVPEQPSVLKVGGLVLDTRSLQLTRDGEPIFLTNSELKICALMMKDPGKVFTKAQLYECLYGSYLESDSNTVMVHISNLRSKLEKHPGQPDYIITVRGLGYKIEEPQK